MKIIILFFNLNVFPPPHLYTKSLGKSAPYTPLSTHLNQSQSAPYTPFNPSEPVSIIKMFIKYNQTYEKEKNHIYTVFCLA